MIRDNYMTTTSYIYIICKPKPKPNHTPIPDPIPHTIVSCPTNLKYTSFTAVSRNGSYGLGSSAPFSSIPLGMYMHVCIYMHVCVGVCICVCMYMCVNMCVVMKINNILISLFEIMV